MNRTVLGLLLLLCVPAFATYPTGQRELTIKFDWSWVLPKGKEPALITNFRKIFAASVAAGDVTFFAFSPAENKMCAVYTDHASFAATFKQMNLAIKDNPEERFTGFFGLRDCDN